ncbi:MAG: hypothetical protein NTY77_11895 [Elusimicrobia bacterium]|nr:hypothetical protein [Elusimicrobiota bacterium]
MRIRSAGVAAVLACGLAGPVWAEGVDLATPPAEILQAAGIGARSMPSAVAWNREHSRSMPRHRFDLSTLNGSYRLTERADAGAGCIVAEKAGDERITVEYDQRVSERSMAPDDHFASINVRTPETYVLSFISDIDQGPMQYTRHDVENPSLLDVAGCVAWYGQLGIADAYRYCRGNVLPKPQPEPAFNPSYFYREVSQTTADNEVVSEKLREVRPSADVTVTSRRITRLKLAEGTLTVTQQEQEGAAAPVTVQRCVYQRD